MFKILIKLIFVFLVTSTATGQETGRWVNPVDIPLKLSGTFGELRSNHFHSGIDIKTGEREGLNVYAVDSGYISRIKIQSGGYGKAIYITHPDGKTSVYAHLQKFNGRINSFVVSEQYRRQSYGVDLYPNPGEFKVSQGEMIAYSGNSGRSGGPHVHFEIRDSNQKPLNPLLLGFTVADRNVPVINYLKVYPAGLQTSINQGTDAKGFSTKHRNNAYTIKTNDTLYIGGPAYFGINTVDLFNGGINKNGVFSVKLSCNGQTQYEHTLSKFDFNESRYINSLIDYKEYKTLKRRVQLAYVQPNNKLSIYGTVVNQGIINFKAGHIYLMEFTVSDAAENTSTLSFVVKGVNGAKAKEQTKHSDPLFSYKQDNSFSTDEVNLKVPARALYDTIYFHYKRKPGPVESFTALHCLHFEYTPLHSWCTLSIKTDSLPENLREKALIARLDKDGEFAAEGGKWENGFITTNIRSFGNYCVVVDTVAPKIKPLNIYKGKSLLAQTSIRIKITDELSGIKKYEGRLNGNWILMAYDEKNDLLIYQFDQLLKSGENLFELFVKDSVGNEAVYKVTLTY